ncbi:unnamed protein product [marine sediment metagenome]|uniref:Uncharacterized protein n=1 Tax=marine sediment metagenome TaxID=412755 RepID=X0SUI1_9ZZZZ
MLIKQGVDRIELGDGEWVDIKDRLTIGDYDRIQRLGETHGPALSTIIVGIMAWNIEEDGKVADLTPENIARMEPVKALEVFTEIGKRNRKPKKGSTRKSTPA